MASVFNRYLERLGEMGIDVATDDTYADVLKELNDINYDTSEVIAAGMQPLQPLTYHIKIYYPISEGGEFPPSAVEYASPNPITPADLINSNAAVYTTSLSDDNVAAYIRSDPKYVHLNDPILRMAIVGGPKLRDVVPRYVEGLVPYQDGY